MPDLLNTSFRPAPLAFLVALVLGSLEASADPLRLQTVALNEGWNAVYLEVDPTERDPDLLFANLPIDVVARYFTPETPVQFITNPADEPWKTKGWGVWYAPGRDDAFLTSLHAIQGNRCYLIHATQDIAWKLTGKVRFQRFTWTKSSFNLFGSCLDLQSPPTFGQFFAGADGKIGSQIFRLVEGKWIKVANPATTRMRAGEACWIYCSGKTAYQGPLDVTIPGSILDFAKSPGVKGISVRNALPDPAGVRVESIEPTGGNRLRLNRVELELSQLRTSYPQFVAPANFPDIGGGKGFRLELQLSSDNLPAEGSTRNNLLKITSSIGAVVWMPMTAGDPVLPDDE